MTMKRMPRCFFAFLSALLVGLALPARTHAVPSIVSISPPEDIGGLGGRLPSIAVDSRDQPHVALDVGGVGDVIFWDKINGVWSGARYSTPGAQWYNPHIEINNDNQAWISGVLWYPYGSGIITRENVDSNPVISGYMTRDHKGWLPISNSSLHPSWKSHGVMNWTRGDWELLRLTANTANPAGARFDVQAAGNVGAMLGGEKHYMWVSKAPLGAGEFPVIHFCTDAYYQNTAHHGRGGQRITWSAYPHYGDMGNDGAYPMVVSDNVEPETAYIANSFQYGVTPAHQGIHVNIFTADRGLLRPANNLLVIDPAGNSGLRRYPPQLYPANRGGAWISYARHGIVMLSYIYVTANREAAFTTATPITSGTRASICVDRGGNIHLVYDDRGFKYRKITVQGDSSQADPALYDMSVFTPAFMNTRRRRQARNFSDFLIYLPAFTQGRLARERARSASVAVPVGSSMDADE